MFTWRRAARKAAEALPAFVPAVVIAEPAHTEPPAASARRKRHRGPPRRSAAIEIDVSGVKVTIENGASPATIAAVIGALKAGS